MAQPTSPRLVFPLEPYDLAPDVYRFGTRVRSRVVLTARHLGDDLIVPAGTPVQAIGEGEVVWARVRPGSAQRRNWGGLVVIAHSAQQEKRENRKEKIENFYSLYGHITDLAVEEGQRVEAGQQVGVVAPGLTPENGWWKIPHLHFAIYVGPWSGEPLPGYKRPFDGRTKFRWWRDPKPFIEEYNKA